MDAIIKTPSSKQILKGQRSIDDALGSLLSQDTATPAKKLTSPRRKSASPRQAQNQPLKKKDDETSDDFYTKLAATVDEQDETDVSEADVSQMAQKLADLDDMDADLFSSTGHVTKQKSTGQSTPRRSGRTPRTPRSNSLKNKSGSSARSLSPPSTSEERSRRLSGEQEIRPETASKDSRPQQNKTDIGKRKSKKFDFGEFDEDDPLAGLLSDDEDLDSKWSGKKTITKPISKPSTESQSAGQQNTNQSLGEPTRSQSMVEQKGSESPAFTRVNQPHLMRASIDSERHSSPERDSHSATSPPPGQLTDLNMTDSVRRPARKSSVTPKKKDDIVFSDDEDMLFGLEDIHKPATPQQQPTATAKPDVPIQQNTSPSKASFMDELLGLGSSSALVETQPLAISKKEFVLDKKYQNKESKDDDLGFAAYTPSSSGTTVKPASRMSVSINKPSATGPLSCDMSSAKLITTNTASLATEDTRTSTDRVKQPLYSITKRFKCFTCRKIFSRRNNLARHMRMHTNSKFPCTECTKTYVTQYELKRHIECNHQGVGNRYPCQKCEKVLKTKQNLALHMRRHDHSFRLTKMMAITSASSKTMPDDCHLEMAVSHDESKVNTTSSLTSEPSNKHTSSLSAKASNRHSDIDQDRSSLDSSTPLQPDKTFTCDICGKMLTTKYILARHMRMHTNSLKVTCLICNSMFSDRYTLNNHIEDTHTKYLDESPTNATDRPPLDSSPKHQAGKRFKCAVCNKMFSRLLNVSRHMRMHNNSKFQCLICNSTYTDKYSLKKHVENVHTGDTDESPLDGGSPVQRSNRFQCEVCAKVLSTAPSLARHMRMHTNSGFACTICNKMFSDKYTMTKHIENEKIHTKNKDESTKKDQDETSLDIPALQVGKRFMCDVCSKVFSRTQNLSRHIRMHNNSKFPCLRCNNTYTDEYNLKKHIENVHGSDGRKLYPCQECEHVFKTDQGLARHIQAHRESFRFQSEDDPADMFIPTKERSRPFSKPSKPDSLSWLELASGHNPSDKAPTVTSDKEPEVVKLAQKESSPADWLGLSEPSDVDIDWILKPAFPPGRTARQAAPTTTRSSNALPLSENVRRDFESPDTQTPAIAEETASSDYLGLGKDIDLDSLLMSKPDSPVIARGVSEPASHRRQSLQDELFSSPPSREHRSPFERPSGRRQHYGSAEKPLESLSENVIVDSAAPTQAPGSRTGKFQSEAGLSSLDTEQVTLSRYNQQLYEPQEQLAREQRTEQHRLMEQQTEQHRLLEQQRIQQLQQQMEMAQEQMRIQQEQQLQQMMSQIQQQYTQQPIQPLPTMMSSVPVTSNIGLPPFRQSVKLESGYQKMDSQTKVSRLEVELDCLYSQLEGTRRRYHEELSAIETSYKNRLNIIEDNYKRREARWKEENDLLFQEQLERIKQLEQNKADLLTQNFERIKVLQEEKAAEIERLKEVQRKAVSDLKSEHSASQQRLKELKEEEIETIVNSHSTTKSLQAVIQQISTNARDLGELQMKADSWQRAGLDDREIHIRTRDEQLKILQARLDRQQSENERERTRLQELIARMEKQLASQTTQLEQERWAVKQELSKLETVQRKLEEDKQLWYEQQTREKTNIDKAKDALLEEQKQVLSQLYDERRSLAEDRNHIELAQRLLREKEQANAIKHVKAEAEYEALTKAVSEERSLSNARKQELQAEEDRIRTEWSRLDKQKDELAKERMKIEKLAIQVKEKSEEIEHITMSVSRTEDEGRTALLEARRLEVEQAHRLHSIQAQMTSLRNKERLLAEEKIRVAEERQELETLRSSLLCVNCRIPVRDSVSSVTHHYPHHSTPVSHHQHPHVTMISSPMQQRVSNTVDSITASIEADRTIRKYKIQAQKDQDFLQEESMFLETLKHSPYHHKGQKAA